LECGGKRSATPLWLGLGLCEAAEFAGMAYPSQSGVALRLAPHSTKRSITCDQIVSRSPHFFSCFTPTIN
jgi:hypothetical protein